MRYVAFMAWRPEEAQKVSDLFTSWRKPEGLRYVLPPHTLLGANRSVIVFECPDEALARVDRYWRQVCCIEIMPVMESEALVKVRP